MPGLAKPFAFHAAHVRAGDRDPHPLVDCAGLFGGTYFSKKDICDKGKKDDGKKGKSEKKNHEHRVVRFGSIYYGYTYEEGETSRARLLLCECVAKRRWS